MVDWLQVMRMDKAKTGALIAAARKERNMTQRELAAALHVSDRAVSKWERGAGFPDISLLEPLADALGLGVLDLLRGERTEERAPAGEQQVREALQILESEVRKRFRRFREIAMPIVGAAMIALFLWGGCAWASTGGDINPREDSRTIGAGYENNCKGLGSWGDGISRIEVSSPQIYAVLTEQEQIDALLETLSRLEVHGQYREWDRPGPLDHSFTVTVDGWTSWTEADGSTHTESQDFLLTFPAFSFCYEGEAPPFLYEAEIDGKDAWTVLRAELEKMTGLT